MKSNEFVKRFGLEDAKEYLCGASFWEIDGTPINPCVNGLKRVVESHKLVEYYGGLESSKSTVNYPNFLNDEDVETTKHRLSKAIEDVESCV